MTPWLRGIFLMGTAAFCSLSPGAAPAPEVIETYGDSVSAGFLSYTSHTGEHTMAEVSHIWTGIATYKANNDVAKWQALHSPELAWPNQLKVAWGATHVLNRAFTQAVAGDILGQVEKAPKVKSDVNVAAFIFIGHNDICKSNDEVEAFEKKYYEEIQRAIKAWDARHTKATLYLLPAGDMSRIYKTLEKRVWYKNEKIAWTCNDSWERIFPFCIENNKRRKDGTLYDTLDARGAAVKKALIRLADEWNKDTKAGNKFRYLPDVLTNEYKPEYFAVDCYHLSGIGEKAMADDVLKNIQK